MADAKVLLWCPTYDLDGEEQLRPETKAYIRQASGPGVDAVISKDNPYVLGVYANVLHQYQRAREMALEGGYRALYTVEHDMWPPDDALEMLDAVDAPVVYGLYMFRHATPLVNAFRDVPSATPDQSLTLYPDELKRAYRLGIVPVSGAGFGCTLMRRQALERAPFRQADGGNPIPDLPFAQDCMRLGIRQMCRMDVRCGHYHRRTWIWPGDQRGGDMVKVLILQNFVASLGSTTQTMRAGDEVEIGEELAADYERAGFLRRISEPAVKVIAKPPHKRKAVKADET